MDIQTLRQTPDPDSLPSDHLRALWYDLNGDWDAAHRIVQQMFDRPAMWIHAYLHRKEPDRWNATYWYGRADQPYPEGLGFEQEAATILAALIQAG